MWAKKEYVRLHSDHRLQILWYTLRTTQSITHKQLHMHLQVFQQRYKMVSQNDYLQSNCILTKHTTLPMHRPPLPLPALLSLLCQIKRSFPVTSWTERLLPANASPHNCHNSLWLPRTPTTARWRHIYDYAIEEHIRHSCNIIEQPAWCALDPMTPAPFAHAWKP